MTVGSTSRCIDAEDAGVAEVLSSLLTLVERHGGQLAPEAVIVERDHELRIECRDGTPDDRPLVVIPADLVVQVGALHWHSDEVRPESGIDTVPETARTVFDALVHLYDICGKVERFRATAPTVAAASDTALAEAIAATRAASVSTFVQPSAAKAFIASRVLALGGGSGRTSGALLVPIVELVNHDPAGGSFFCEDDCVGIRPVRTRDSGECFVTYGPQRDPLDLAIHFGFTSDRSGIAHSVPVTVDLPGGRRVRVRGERPGGFVQPSTTMSEGVLTLDSLTFRRRDPLAARTSLSLPIRSWVLRDGGSDATASRLAEAAFAEVVEANVTSLDTLRLLVDGRADGVGELLRAAVDLQLDTVMHAR